MSSARKRPRPEVDNDNKAECPFTIRVIDPKEKDQKKKKRRRTEADDDDGGSRPSLQLPPFSPAGQFKTHSTLDLYYQVEPQKKWTDMTRYNSFVLNGIKYFSEGFIYVANDTSVEREKTEDGKDQSRLRKKSEDDWVARILEIRASDEHHVYARVYWMYWPDELPPGTHDAKRVVQGRQPYHGANELVASNHMDIINVVSVTSSAVVNQWDEENDEEIQNALYWRQAFDVRTYELSSVDIVCKCSLPGNPDKTLIGCTTESCKQWLHEDCIKHEALLATYRRLGTDKPHITAKDDKTATTSAEPSEGQRPLSPVEATAGMSTQQSIDVKQAATAPPNAGTPQKASNTADNVEVGGSADQPEPTSSSKGPSQSQRESTADSGAAGAAAATATPSRPGPKKGGRGRKKARAGSEVETKPYQGLFAITLKVEGSPMLEFRDLRQGVVGGDKTWTEPIKCLVCGELIN